jgi:hypothetical protein
MATFFSDRFGISPSLVTKHGAFDVSLITDLPLFIDPFLLFNSRKRRYRQLHAEIIKYLVFLRDKAHAGHVDTPLLRAWYCFPEIKQTWLGFSRVGNRGSGLGMDFAVALHGSLHKLFPEFGVESITKGSHLEKVCLVRDGVGRDNISDFTTNLIKGFLCEFTQTFAVKHLAVAQRRLVSVGNVKFNYETEVWEPGQYELPWIDGDFIILTPKDLLTRDENWINKGDLIRDFEELPPAIPDSTLRAQVNNYFDKVLARHRGREPSAKERAEAAVSTILQFPEIIDYYIRYKEEHGDDATTISAEKVRTSEKVFHTQLRELQKLLKARSAFYSSPATTYEEAHQRLAYLKDVIEHKGGHRYFYLNGKPIRRELDLQIMYRLVWIGSPSDVSTEVNDGRGPADYKISRGAADKTIIELKLAKNTQLKRNLQNQAPVYQRASDAKRAIKAILFFTRHEELHVRKILADLKLAQDRDIVLIDARSDNKPSGSKA